MEFCRYLTLIFENNCSKIKSNNDIERKREMFDELVRDLLALSPEDLSLFSAYIAALDSRDTPALPSEPQAVIS